MGKLMQYLNSDDRIRNSELERYLKCRVKHMIREHRLDREMQVIKKMGQDEIEATAFSFCYKGKKMMALLLFWKERRYPEEFTAAIAVFSDHFLYVTNERLITRIWDPDCKVEWTPSLHACLRAYDRMYPHTGLGPYLTQYEEMKVSGGQQAYSSNFLPLLFAQFNKGLELLVKSKLNHIAEKMLLLDDGSGSALAKDPASYSNLQEWLGVSMNVLRKLDSMLEEADAPRRTCFDRGWWRVIGNDRKARRALGSREFFDRLADIAKYNPAYLNIPVFTPAVLHFFMTNHLIHRSPANSAYTVCRRISGVSRMEDRAVLTVIRHIASLSWNDAEEYMAYLDLCGKSRMNITEYPLGLTPHKLRWEVRYEERLLRSQFRAGLVKRFAWSADMALYQMFDNREEAVRRKDSYCVIAPEQVGEVIREGWKLGHCVATYAKPVADGETYIVFLRRTEKPNEPFVTMEVDKHFTLIQVKARGDAHASVDAQEYVRRWADEQGLDICTSDLDESA